LRDATSVYRVDADLLKALAPSVIVTQSHCEVCAVSAKDVEGAICDWLGWRPRIVSLAPNNLMEVWDSILQVAAALDAPERGEVLVGRLLRRVDDIAARAAGLTARPTVACLEWLDPLMAGATGCRSWWRWRVG